MDLSPNPRPRLEGFNFPPHDDLAFCCCQCLTTTSRAPASWEYVLIKKTIKLLTARARARCCRRPHASCAARPLVLLLVFHNTRIAEMHVRSDGQDGRNCEMHLALIDFIINSLIECEVDRVHPKHRSAIGIVQKTFELCKTKLDATCDWVAG